MNKYDAMYIFTQSFKDDSWAKLIERMQGEITRLGGTILSTEELGKRTFARVMQKRENGVYVKIRFELDPAQLAHLRDRYHLIEDLFRVQFLAVDERMESKIAEQAAARKAREAAAREEAPAAAQA